MKRQTASCNAGTIAAVVCFVALSSQANSQSTQSLSELRPGWTNIVPADAGTCALGDEFSFWARPGDPSKLLVTLEGGGACWSGQHCALDAQPTYAPFAGSGDDPTLDAGIFDLEHPENPVADYSMVYISTCNADVFLGDSEVTYDVESPGAPPDTVTIQHRGYPNTMAALNWVFNRVEAPETVFVVGWSAGAIPSPIYTSIIADRYPDARIAHFADGAGAYRAGDKLAPFFENHGTLDVLAEVGGYEGFTTETLSFEDFYVVESGKHPEITYHQYNTVEDHIAYKFLGIMGIVDTPLTELREAAHAYIRRHTDRFRTYTAWGDQENVMGGYFDGVLAQGNENNGRPYALDRFYTYQVNGIRFRDWFAAIAAGESVDDVHCTDCVTPEYAWARSEE